MGDIFEALANPARRQILVLLRRSDLTAGEIAERLPLAKSSLSQHFNILKASDLIRSTRSGTTITYSLNTSVVEEGLMEFMRLFNRSDKKREGKSWKAISGLAGSSSRSR